MEQIRSGTIKGLPSAAKRLPTPRMPTFEEAGVPGIVLTGWLGIYGPPKCRKIRAKLGEAIVEVVNQPDIQKLRASASSRCSARASDRHHEAEVKRWVVSDRHGLRK